MNFSASCWSLSNSTRTTWRPSDSSLEKTLSSLYQCSTQKCTTFDDQWEIVCNNIIVIVLSFFLSSFLSFFPVLCSFLKFFYSICTFVFLKILSFPCNFVIYFLLIFSLLCLFYLIIFLICSFALFLCSVFFLYLGCCFLFFILGCFLGHYKFQRSLLIYLLLLFLLLCVNI